MKDLTRNFNSGRNIFFLMVFACCILAGAVLKIASSVIIPFTVAILLAFVMYPLVRGLNKLRCPRLISIFLVVIIMVTGLYIFGMVLFTSGKMIIARYPNYENRLTEIYIWAANLFELPYDDELSIWENLWGQLEVRSLIRNFSFSFSNFFFKTISSAVLVSFLWYFC